MQTTYQNLTKFLPFNPLNHTQLWLATDSFTQKKVVIKQLTSGFTAIQYKQFYQEYRVYQRLAELPDSQKPFFPTLLDFYREHDTHFLVLACYAGQTLKQLIAENSLTFTQKVHIARQLCQAVEIFHSLDFIHGDIKPSNIVITENQFKLLDFGLTTQANDNKACHTLTAGTPAYMSPEQFTGNEVTYQTDYYSVGVVMYELFFGEKPFLADTLENWAITHCQLPVPPVTLFECQQNQRLQGIFNALLAKYPINRATDLLTIKADLKKLQES